MRRVCLRPLDDPRGIRDDLALVGDEDRHGALAAQALDLAPAVGRPLHEARSDAQAADLDHLRVIAGEPKSFVGVMAGMPARPRRLYRRPADVELHALGLYPGCMQSSLRRVSARGRVCDLTPRLVSIITGSGTRCASREGRTLCVMPARAKGMAASFAWRTPHEGRGRSLSH